MWQRAARRSAAGAAPGVIAARFHQGLGAGVAAHGRRSSLPAGDAGRFGTVALSRRRIPESHCCSKRCMTRLRAAGYSVLSHRPRAVQRRRPGARPGGRRGRPRIAAGTHPKRSSHVPRHSRPDRRDQRRRRTCSAWSTCSACGARSTSPASSTTSIRSQSCVGDWVLVHVGFAMSRIDEHEAAHDARSCWPSSARRRPRSRRCGARRRRATERVP